MRRILTSLLFLGILAGIIYYVLEQKDLLPSFPTSRRTVVVDPTGTINTPAAENVAQADNAAATPVAAPVATAAPIPTPASPADPVSPQPADQPLPNVDLYSLSTHDFQALPQLQQHIPQSSFNITLLEAAVFHETNHQRTLNNLPIFKYSAAMNLMARQHSQEMSDLQYFEHDSPVPANHSLGDRLKNVGLVNVTAGENIAVLPALDITPGRGYLTYPSRGDAKFDEVTGKQLENYTYAGMATAVLTQWMNSPHHHENIVNKDFRYLGIGVARGPYDANKQDSFYFTQNFTATIKPESEAQSKAKLAR